MNPDGLAAGARFPEELIPHEAARRLLEALGVKIVAGDAELIAQAREHARLRGQRERHQRSARAADERVAHMPYRRKTSPAKSLDG